MSLQHSQQMRCGRRASKGSVPLLIFDEAKDRFGVANGLRRSPRWSDIDGFGDVQGVLEINTQVAHGAVHLGVAEQELDCTKISRFPVDLRRLGASQRMRSVAAWLKTDRRHPISNEARILPGRDVLPVVKAARKEERTADHLGPRDPVRDRETGVFRDFELNGPLCLALNDRCAFSSAITDDEICDLQPDQVTAAKLAVDGEIEQHQITQIARELEAYPDGLNLFGQQGTFLADEPGVS